MHSEVCNGEKKIIHISDAWIDRHSSRTVEHALPIGNEDKFRDEVTRNYLTGAMICDNIIMNTFFKSENKEIIIIEMEMTEATNSYHGVGFCTKEFNEWTQCVWNHGRNHSVVLLWYYSMHMVGVQHLKDLNILMNIWFMTVNWVRLIQKTVFVYFCIFVFRSFLLSNLLSWIYVH